MLREKNMTHLFNLYIVYVKIRERSDIYISVIWKTRDYSTIP